jgi:hypothetical protein
MQSDDFKSLVAQFVSETIAKSDRSIDDIALDASIQPKVLQMIMAGTAKLAINQANDLAQALKVDGIYLLRLILEDYLPESWSIIQDKLAELAITPYEQEILEGYRQLSQGREIAVFMFPAAPHVEVVPPK